MRITPRHEQNLKKNKIKIKKRIAETLIQRLPARVITLFFKRRILEDETLDILGLSDILFTNIQTPLGFQANYRHIDKHFCFVSCLPFWNCLWAQLDLAKRMH